MAKFPQPSLSGGELAPGLHGRVDVARYLVSVAECRNFITRPTGGAVKRPGVRYNGAAKTTSRDVRLIPFVYSTEIKYLIEAGVGYFRFWIPATPYGYALLESGGVPVEVATPYTADHLPLLRTTQSADVLYIAGINGGTKVPPKTLKRTTSTSFTLTDFDFRRGPFRSLNADSSIILTTDGVTGNITVTSNVGIFTEAMVGGLLHLEEKELRAVKPWTSLEKNVPLNAQRRSDGKVYRCVSVPSVVSPAFYVCGSNRPLHEIGRDFDGPQDVRNDGVNDYTTGVEWEYLHGAFGIVKITGFVSATQVTGIVVERLAESIRGASPAAVAGPWTLSGDGTTKTFAVAGATSDTQANYQVVIDGAAIPSNPYQGPVSGGGGTGGGGSTGPVYEDGLYRDLP